MSEIQDVLQILFDSGFAPESVSLYGTLRASCVASRTKFVQAIVSEILFQDV